MCTVRTPFYARLLLPFHIIYSGLSLSLFCAFCDTLVFVSFLPLLLLCFLSFFFITFLFLYLITSYCLLLLFLSLGLVSVKISENILIGLYSQRLSACNSSNTAGEYYYNDLLQYVVTYRLYLKSDNGDGQFAGRPMLVYAYISTATRTHLAKYLFNRKMFGKNVVENYKMHILITVFFLARVLFSRQYSKSERTHRNRYSVRIFSNMKNTVF